MTTSASNSSAPCGAWPSPISADLVAAGASPLSLPQQDGADTYWLAGRASEGGRNTLLRQRGADVSEVTPAPFNVRTRVHEYGGGAYLVADGVVYFSNFADNRLYVVADGAAPRALNAEDNCRYADFVRDRARARLISVREEHSSASAYPAAAICAIDDQGASTVLWP